MSTYSVTHSCGHTESHKLYGPETSRQTWMASAALRLCRPCTRAAELAVAADLEGQLELPALVCTPSQSDWSRCVRATLLTSIETYLLRLRARIPETQPDKMMKFDQRQADLLQALYSKTRAGFWLDNRDRTPEALLELVWAEIKGVSAA
jgi:hypothetical protein